MNVVASFGKNDKECEMKTNFVRENVIRSLEGLFKDEMRKWKY